MENILVIAELFEGKVRKPTLSAITFAKMVATHLNSNFDVIVLGKGIQQAVEELKRFGATKVYVGDDSYFENYLCEKFAPTIVKVVKEGGYKFVVATADVFGKELIPRIAAKLDAGIASDIIDVVFENSKVLYKRPLFAGNVIGVVELKTNIHAVSVRQANFEPAKATDSDSQVVKIEPVIEEYRKEFVKFDKVVSERPELTEARIVVSGGRGVKDREGYKEYVEKLADLLGAATGATRALVDAGVVPNDLQVGQTGKVVAPDLYIAIGLSGALQHVAGMKGSKVIVAINKDEEAPIFQVADYGIVADLRKAVPELIEEIKKIKSES